MGGLFFKKGVDKLEPTTKPFFQMEIKDIDGKPTILE